MCLLFCVDLFCGSSKRPATCPLNRGTRAKSCGLSCVNQALSAVSLSFLFVYLYLTQRAENGGKLRFLRLPCWCGFDGRLFCKSMVLLPAGNTHSTTLGCEVE